MDGYTVCRRIRKQMLTYIPVLILTQRGDVEDRVDGLEVGADDYLPKPFDERELLARIAALLRIKQLQDELQHRLENERRAYESLRQIALTDSLTGVYNRHHFANMLQREFDTARRYGTPLACIMIDIDHFRNFNNRYGHAIGDWVLQGVARLFMENVRRVDIVARYGGEEFVILLPMSNLRAATETATRLRQLVETRWWESPAGPLQITISLGVAAFPEVAVDTAEDLMNCADRALLRAKENGRNRVEKWGLDGSEGSP
jgi:diguanylate cyclase (GGDEF)-like protein